MGAEPYDDVLLRRWPGASAGLAFLCVSGLGRPADDWSKVAPALSVHGGVLAAELPPPRPGRARDLLDADRRRLEQLMLAHASASTVLIGHSLGGVVALLVAGAAASAGPPRGLVLTSPFLPVALNGRSAAVTALDYAHHRALFIRESARRRPRPLPPRSLRADAARLRSLASLGLRPAGFHAVADRATCPILLIHGHDDHYVPRSFAIGAARRHPAWQLDLIADSGHFPQRDQPELWVAAVERWVSTLGPG